MSTKQRLDVHQAITDRVIEMMETAGDLKMPWHRDQAGLPSNAVTGAQYRGVNILSLWVAQMQAGFSAPLWGTYRQWQSIGAQVRKGEKSSLSVFYKTLKREDENGETLELPYARASFVFNVDQVDGYALPEADSPAENRVSPVGLADRFVRHCGAEIRQQGQMAYFDNRADQITMPPPERFYDTEGYYAVLLHELTHWTKHPSRLNRQLDSYAIEELVAELGAAYLCADLGVSNSPREDHASYLAHWLQALRDDKRLLFRAASIAQKAVSYLHSLQPAEEERAA